MARWNMGVSLPKKKKENKKNIYNSYNLKKFLQLKKLLNLNSRYFYAKYLSVDVKFFWQYV